MVAESMCSGPVGHRRLFEQDSAKAGPKAQLDHRRSPVVVQIVGAVANVFAASPSFRESADSAAAVAVTELAY